MPILNSIAASLAISQILFFAVFITLHHRATTVAKLLILFSLCFSAYLLTTIPILVSNPYVSFVLYRLAVASPALIWLVAVLLFADSHRVPRRAFALIALYLCANGAGAFLYYIGHDFHLVTFLLTFALAQVIMLGFAVHAVYLGITGKTADLIEARRRVRMPFVIAMGALNVLIIGTGIVNYALSVSPLIDNPSQAILYSSTLLSFLAFLVCLYLNIKMFSMHSDATIVLAKSAVAPQFDTPVPTTQRKGGETELIKRIKTAMEQERMYREMGFTLGRLSEHLGVQDYQLRRAINDKLGFRNFNQFLNEFRIAEASELLAHTREPIATIALNVGYASLSSFNKAFKEQHGIPPRDYRGHDRVAEPPKQNAHAVAKKTAYAKNVS